MKTQVHKSTSKMRLEYLEIELCLDLWRDVDGVGRRPGRGQGRSGLGKVAESMVSLALQKLDLE